MCLDNPAEFKSQHTAATAKNQEARPSSGVTSNGVTKKNYRNEMVVVENAPYTSDISISNETGNQDETTSSKVASKEIIGSTIQTVQRKARKDQLSCQRRTHGVTQSVQTFGVFIVEPFDVIDNIKSNKTSIGPGSDHDHDSTVVTSVLSTSNTADTTILMMLTMITFLMVAIVILLVVIIGTDCRIDTNSY